MVVTGSHFDSTSIVEVNGSARATTFVSATSVIGHVDAQDIVTAGSVQIIVVNNEDSGVIQSLPATLSVSSGPVPAAVSEPVLSLSATFDTSLGGTPMIQQAFTVSVNGPTNATYYYVMSYTGSAISSLGLNGTLRTGTTTPAGPTAGRLTGEPNGGLGGVVSGSFTGPTLTNITVSLVNAAQMELERIPTASA